MSEDDFLRLIPEVVHSKKTFADVLDTAPRRSWTYPMRVTPDGKCYLPARSLRPSAHRPPADIQSFYPGSTDMVRMWEALGFVTRIEIPQQLPIYVEVQRLLPTDTGGDIVPKDAPTAQDVQKALGTKSQWQLNSKGRLVPSSQ